MVWTNEKTYLVALFVALILAIVASLYFNRSPTGEGYESQNRKILIIYTGGTIGMVKTPDGYEPKPGFLEQKLRAMTKNANSISPYDVTEFSPLLDSMTPGDWVKIGINITKKYNKYDAFIVVHGTDTMAYTASALSFMLENLDKPVIVTGSMISLQEERNDGRANLLTSLELASKYKIPEVVICFGNRILRGCRTTKVSANSIQAFASPNFPPLCKDGVTNDAVILDPPDSKFKFMPINPKNRVVVVKLFPGIDAKFLAGVTRGGIQGIVLETFGIGDAPTKKSFLSMINNLVKDGVIIVNVSQCLRHNVDEKDYVDLQRAGVITGLDMTTEAALAKVYFLVSHLQDPGHELVSNLIQKSMRGELGGY